MILCLLCPINVVRKRKKRSSCVLIAEAENPSKNLQPHLRGSVSWREKWRWWRKRRNWNQVGTQNKLKSYWVFCLSLLDSYLHSAAVSRRRNVRRIRTPCLTRHWLSTSLSTILWTLWQIRSSPSPKVPPFTTIGWSSLMLAFVCWFITVWRDAKRD